MTKLAVCSPYIGTPSETFICRHMCDLLPGRTVVVANSDQPPAGVQWTVDAPTYLTKKRQQGLSSRIVHFALKKLGYESKTMLERQIGHFLCSNQVQVILAEYLDYSLKYLPIAKRHDIPLFAHAHGYDISMRLRDPYWRNEYLKLNQCAGVITMSEFSRQRLLKLGIHNDKIYVVPYGIKVPHLDFDANDKRKSGTRLLSVGRMVSKKAPILLLDSFRRAAEVCPDIHLDFVGGGALLTAAQHYVKAFHLEHRVTFHGVLDNEQVLKLMKKADVFIQHSVTCPETGDEEGMPVAILEAMAYALPVVSTFHAGIPEAVLNEETGFLVNEGDSSTMAQKIIELVKNPGLAKNMGLAARNRILANFTWEREKKLLQNLMNLGG